MSEKEKAGLTLQDMMQTQEWSEKRSRIALSGQYKCDKGELDKRAVREQSKDNTAVGLKDIAMEERKKKVNLKQVDWHRDT